jgi:hypothetical protein
VVVTTLERSITRLAHGHEGPTSEEYPSDIRQVTESSGFFGSEA